MDADNIREHMRNLKRRRLISRTTFDVGCELLTRVSNHWTIYLARQEACEVCGVTNWGSARRSLGRLQDAGIIRLHTNNQAYITFLEPPAPDPDCAESARVRAESARERAGTAQEEAAEPADPRQNCAQSRSFGALTRRNGATARSFGAPPKDQDQDQQQEGRNDPSLPNPSVLEGGAGGNRPNAQERRADAQSGAAIDPDEQARSVALLTDIRVGLYLKPAQAAAARYPFRQIAAQVFRYLRDRQAGSAGSPGCIPYRLAAPQQFPAEMEISDFDDPLWLDYAGEEDLEWGRGAIRRKYIPDEWSHIIRG